MKLSRWLWTLMFLWVVLVCSSAQEQQEDDDDDNDKKQKNNKNDKTASPTTSPTISPAPTPIASAVPSSAPTRTPPPTVTASEEPTMAPTTLSPTLTASEEPTMSPTTLAPTVMESEEPTMGPTTETPSTSPSLLPSPLPTIAPTTASPTVSPAPSVSPSVSPAPSLSQLPTSAPTVMIRLVDLPQLQIALNRATRVRGRFLLQETDLSDAMQRFLDEFLRGRFPDSFVRVRSKSTLNDQDVLTTTGTAAFRPRVPDDFLEVFRLYFEFFGRQELEEDLGDFGVGSVASIRMDGEQIEPRGTRATAPDDSDENRNKKEPKTGAIIIGIAVASIVLCVLVSLLAFRGRRRMRELDGEDKENADDLVIQETNDADEEDSPRKIDAAEAESEDDKGSSQYPKPVYIRPYAEKADDDPSEYTSDGDIVSIGSSQVTPRKPPVRNAPTGSTTDSLPTSVDPVDVAKSGKESLRSYQYDASRLDEVISKTKQSKK